MSKRKKDWAEIGENKRARLDVIGSFWKNHYKINGNETSKIEDSEVFKLFLKLNPGINIDIKQFKSLTPTIGVKSRRIRRKVLYLAEPYSSCAVEFHSQMTSKEDSKTQSPAQIHLINIQGLITNAKIKGE